MKLIIEKLYLVHVLNQLIRVIGSLIEKIILMFAEFAILVEMSMSSKSIDKIKKLWIHGL